MSNLVDNSISVYEALKNIENCKYVMPAFQRQYVWSMEQVEKLWDSILLDYPIATFLFWHVDNENVTSDTNFCNFLTKATFNNRKLADSTNYELSEINFDYTDTAILDGQQRLTSLYLSLFGETHIREKHTRKKYQGGILAELLIELNKNKLTIDEEEYNSKKYDIKFSDKIGKISPTQFKIKKLVDEKFKNPTTRQQAIQEAIVNVPKDKESREYAQKILEKLCSKIYDEKLIRYTEIGDMKQDDALEMFVRFNSGGKALKKSEITMSILEAYWPSSKKEFGEILVDSFEGFGTDFIIRTALMLFGDVIKSNINRKIAEDLKNNWEDFKNALKNLDSLLTSFGIDVNRFSSSWNVLLPIIYTIYYNNDYNSFRDGIKVYLIRAILFTYYQSGTTSKLQQLKSNINDNEYEITIDMLEQMNELRLTDGRIEDILNSEKGSRVASEALYFLSNDWINKNYNYEQDHLHPHSRFDGSKPVSVSIEDWKLWRSNRNRLPNLHLLEGRSNGSKSDMSLQEYYNDMNEEQKNIFIQHSFIPTNQPLAFEFFGKFYEERKKLLSSKLRQILS